MLDVIIDTIKSWRSFNFSPDYITSSVEKSGVDFKFLLTVVYFMIWSGHTETTIKPVVNVIIQKYHSRINIPGISVNNLHLFLLTFLVRDFYRHEDRTVPVPDFGESAKEFIATYMDA